MGPSGPKVTLLDDGQMDRRTDGRTDNGFKGVVVKDHEKIDRVLDSSASYDADAYDHL